ncbi:MAG: hypothetical protein KDF65_12960, partial [Anaerolineae bacterium]|nr:hypothetical protein [Anaerolineae bacterium]
MKANLNPSQTITNRQASSRQTVYYLGQTLFYLGLIILGGVAIWLGIKATRVYGSYQRLNQHISTLEAVRADFNLSEARAGLQGVSRELEILTTEAAPFLPLAPYLGWLPTYGSDVQALPTLVALARHMGQSGTAVDKVISPLFEAINGAAEDPLPALVAGLVEVQPQVSALEAALQNDQLALEKLDEQQLTPALARRVEQAKEYLPYLITGFQLTKRLPTMLGATSPRTYLI